MNAHALAPTVGLVTDGDEGARIRDRRTQLGVSIKALAERAGVDRGRLTAIERGAPARDSTLGVLERTLSELEREKRGDLPPGTRRIGDPADDLIEFIIEGTDGIKAVVKGPIRDMEALQAAAQKLIQGMQLRPPAENGA